MAIIKFTNSKSTLKYIISYVTQETKTNNGLITGKDCTSENALAEMQSIKNVYNKNGGRQYIHMVQSFHPDDDITYEKAHEIGLKMAEQYKGFQVLVATHMDREHVHNHLIINSVSFENGKKFQQSNKSMEKIKEYSNNLCDENGYRTIPLKSNSPALSQAEYQVAIKGDSWKMRLINAIDYAMQYALDKETFITYMKDLGYGVTWTDTRKNITYTTPEGMKCRDNKLYDIKYLKENMENEFSKQFKGKKSNTTANTNESRVLHSTTRNMDNSVQMDRGNKRQNQRYGIQTNSSNDNRRREYAKTGNTRPNKDTFSLSDGELSKEFERITKEENNRNFERDTNRDCSRFYSSTPLDALVSLAFIFQSRPQENNRPRRTIRRFSSLSKQAQKEWIYKHRFGSSCFNSEDEMEM
jgi:hypothetical protein